MTATAQSNGEVSKSSRGMPRLEDVASGAATAGSQRLNIVIPPIDMRVLKVPIVGTSPLIMHAWDPKAIRNMLDVQQKKAKKPREAKNPAADYQAALYLSNEGWPGMPAGAFRSAIIGSCRLVEGLAMTVARRICFIVPDGFDTAHGKDLVRIHGDHRMREDMVRLESGVPDIRYRPEFLKWEAILTVRYNAGVVSDEQLLALIELAGQSEGIGELRPGKSDTGTNGMWRVARGKEVARGKAD